MKDIVKYIALFFIIGCSVFHLDEMPLLKAVFSLIRFPACFFFIYRYFTRHHCSKLFLLLTTYFFAFFIITFIQKGELIAIISIYLNLIALLMFFETESPHDAIRILAGTWGFVAFINFLLIAFIPQDIIWGNYLIGGNRNQMGLTLLCTLLTYQLYYIDTRRHLYMLFIINIICLFSVLFVHSMTSSLGLVLLTLFFIVPARLKTIALRGFIIAYIFLVITLLILQSNLDSYKFIVYFVENIMQRDLTFSDRIWVWIDSIHLIRQSPILGYGMRHNEWFERHLGVLSTHDIYLQILIYGGIVLLSCFCVIMLVAFMHSLRSKSTSTRTIQFSTCVAFLMMLMENYHPLPIFYFLILLYYAPCLTTQTQKR